MNNAENRISPLPGEIKVGVLTGGQDRHYASGLALALALKGIRIDVLGSDDIDSPEFHCTPRLTFLNLRRSQRRDAGLVRKVVRVLVYYLRLIRYAARDEPRILHILWNNKFVLFDRTLLMLYYKAIGKKVVLTAHNVNAARRDSTDTVFNHLTLRAQYKLADHVFVHTEKMKQELVEEFGTSEELITVIPYGINNAVPNTDLTPNTAKERLGLRGNEKVILFFGAIAPYKGLDLLVSAFQHLAASPEYRLVIAGRPEAGREGYWKGIQRSISEGADGRRILQKIEYISDGDIELYFKAADLLVLPYREIFQSGILFLGYSFGIPVVATDVGSFREDIVEGKTGFLCKAGDPIDLAKTIEKYFESGLFRGLSCSRREIKGHTNAEHSWDVVGEMTRKVYATLLTTGV